MGKIWTAIGFILIFTIVGFLLFCIGAVMYQSYQSFTATEIEVYSVGCEVSQVAYAEEAISRSQTRPVYKMGVRNDDFAHTFDITDVEFAKYTIDDIVEIEVTVWESPNGEQFNTYKLLGLCKG